MGVEKFSVGVEKIFGELKYFHTCRGVEKFLRGSDFFGRG